MGVAGQEEFLPSLVSLLQTLLVHLELCCHSLKLHLQLIVESSSIRVLSEVLDEKTAAWPGVDWIDANFG